MSSDGVFLIARLDYISKGLVQVTVIAQFDEIGVAISDVMLSSSDTESKCWLPSIGYLSQGASGNDLVPTRLARKFFRFHKNNVQGMFLCAGTVSHINRLYRNMIGIFDRDLELPAKILNRLNTRSPESVLNAACELTEEEGFPDFEIIGVIDGIGFLRHHNFALVNQQIPYFGTSHFAGSGGPILKRFLEQRGDAWLSFGVGSSMEEKFTRALLSR